MKTKQVLTILLCSAGLVRAVAGAEEPLSQWQWRHPLPQGYSMAGVAIGNDRYVAVGGSQTMVSTDGSEWQLGQHEDPISSLGTIIFGNGLFVALGTCPAIPIDQFSYLIPSTILTSTDGQHWVRRYGPDTNTLNHLAFGNGRFVAVGHFGRILTSTDGIVWSPGVNPLTNSLTIGPVSFGNGIFVARAANVATLVSVDGVTWTSRSGPAAYHKAMVYGNGLFVTAGDYSLGFLRSSNGLDWAAASTSMANMSALAYGAGVFVTVGSGGRIAISTNASDWSYVVNQGRDLWAVTYGNGLFLATGHSGTLLTSSNGVTWQDQQLRLADGRLNSVVFGDGKFVAVGETSSSIPFGGSTVMVSTNGRDWSPSFIPGGSGPNDIAYGNGLFVATWYFRSLAISSDGITWESRPDGSPINNAAICFGNGTFVVVGSGIATSTDGVGYVNRLTTAFKPQNDVAYGNDQFISVGNDGISYRSTDGTAWTLASYGDYTVSMRSIAWGNGLFVSVGTRGAIRTTSTGSGWVEQNSGTTNVLVSAAFGNGIFVVLDAFGGLLTSEDGIRWTRQPGPGLYYGQLAYGLGTFVAVGDYSSIFQSGDLRVPRLAPDPGLLPNGFALRFSGETLRPVQLERSLDLRNWTNALTFTPTQATTRLLDAAATNAPQFFYRTQTPGP